MSSNTDMATDKSTSIDLSTLDTLEFQDFSVSKPSPAVIPEDKDSHSFLPGHGPGPGDEEDGDETPFDKKPSSQESTSILELSFLAKYFDVSTQDVIDRIIYSFVPVGGPSTGTTSTGDTYM